MKKLLILLNCPTRQLKIQYLQIISIDSSYINF